MPRYGEITTNKSYPEVMRELQVVFRKWGVTEYSIPRFSEAAKAGGAVEISFKMDDVWLDLACGRFTWGRNAPVKNLLALVIALDGFRLADERGIADFRAKIIRGFKALPPADDFDPHKVLRVARDAPKEVIRAAYRALARSTHGDTGSGDTEAFQRIHRAGEELGVSG